MPSNQDNDFSPLDTQHASDLSDSIALSRVPPQYKQMIVNASQARGVPIHMLANVAKMESNFNPSATSGVGAMGMMQLMPKTAQSLGVSNPYDPEQSVNGSANYLSQLLNKYSGNETMALAAYNWGPGNLAKHGITNAPAETQNYLSKYNSLIGNNQPLMSKNPGSIGNLPQQIVNGSVPDTNSSINAKNPNISNLQNVAVQQDFPNSPVLYSNNNDEDTTMPQSQSISSSFGLKDLFGGMLD